MSEFEAHIFWSFHRCLQIKVFGVHHEAFRVWGGDDAVCEDFEEGHIRCWCFAVIRVVDSDSPIVSLVHFTSSLFGLRSQLKLPYVTSFILSAGTFSFLMNRIVLVGFQSIG